MCNVLYKDGKFFWYKASKLDDGIKSETNSDRNKKLIMYEIKFHITNGGTFLEYSNCAQMYLTGNQIGGFLCKNTRKVAKIAWAELVEYKLDKKHFTTLFIMLSWNNISWMVYLFQN